MLRFLFFFTDRVSGVPSSAARKRSVFRRISTETITYRLLAVVKSVYSPVPVPEEAHSAGISP